VDIEIDKDLVSLFSSSDKGTKLVTFVNPFSYYILKDEHNGIIGFMDHIFADGIMLVRLNNFLYPGKLINRYSFDFTSLAPVVFKHAIEKNMKVALVGGSETEISMAVDVLSNRFPLLDITFSRSGYFANDVEFNKSLVDMKKLGINVVICGMGTPLQEKYIIECKEQLPDLRYGFTCGGFLSQISSREDYFNPLLNKLNLRWLQRAYRHSYVRRRLLVDYPQFVFKFVKQRFI
jgi:exopolysaccharide biosynthesis WecB/TagA/CpsF family protein